MTGWGQDAVFGDQVIPHPLATGTTHNVDSEKGVRARTPVDEKIVEDERREL